MKPSSSLCQFALLLLGPGAPLMLNLKHPNHRFDAPGAFGPTRVVMWATIAVESSFIFVVVETETVRFDSELFKRDNGYHGHW